MKKLFGLTVVVLTVCTCFAQFTTRPAVPSNFHVVGSNSVAPPATNVIPVFSLPFAATNGVIAWNPGVPGGIPSYSYCNSVTNFGAIGDGVADDYPAFANAVTACTNGGYVFVPPGHYRCSKTIRLQKPKQIALRGLDPSTTFMESYTTNDWAPIVISAEILGAVTHHVRGGMIRGSTTLSLDSVSEVAVGMTGKISQDNNPADILGRVASGSSCRQSQIFTVTSVNGLIVGIDRPLYCTYDTAFNPIVDFSANATQGCGVENLTVVCERQPTGDGYGIIIYNAKQCWVKNCIVSNAPHANIVLQYALQCEVRDSAVYNHQAYDSNARYGIQLCNYATDCLVENNIVQGNNLAIVLQEGAVGNVAGYNFSDRGYGLGYPTTQFVMYGIAFHGSNPNMNLAEGNVVPTLSIDDFWGCNRMNTCFRNWATWLCYVNPSNQLGTYGDAPLLVEATNYFNNFVANVLYQPRNTTGAAYDLGHSQLKSVFSPSPPYDTLVLSNTFLHGNFDFVSRSIQWSNGLNQTFPASYYLASKPAWFGSLRWPPIGPDVNTTDTITNFPVIPAQARARGVAY
jgi:hypothetical protein